MLHRSCADSCGPFFVGKLFRVFALTTVVSEFSVPTGPLPDGWMDVCLRGVSRRTRRVITRHDNVPRKRRCFSCFLFSTDGSVASRHPPTTGEDPGLRRVRQLFLLAGRFRPDACGPSRDGTVSTAVRGTLRGLLFFVLVCVLSSESNPQGGCYYVVLVCVRAPSWFVRRNLVGGIHRRRGGVAAKACSLV